MMHKPGLVLPKGPGHGLFHMVSQSLRHWLKSAQLQNEVCETGLLLRAVNWWVKRDEILVEALCRVWGILITFVVGWGCETSDDSEAEEDTFNKRHLWE